MKYDTIHTSIYIPVWIDQKLPQVSTETTEPTYLHSSMDRLETLAKLYVSDGADLFTFQYGQIRNV